MSLASGTPELRSALETEARKLGFSLVGVTTPEPSGHMELYRSWIERDEHGEMAYLAREDSVERRADLRRTMPDVRSVLVVADDYAPSEPGDAGPASDSHAIIARYARGSDYHVVLARKLERLRDWLDANVDGGVRGRVYVDTGPVLERDVASRAGLGWFGRNTMIINPSRGSYFFLGCVLLDVDIPADEPFTEDRCGSCRACLDACPTGALLGRDETGAPRIDARRCISYLTIELRGAIPMELREGIGNRAFGCDICQEVCPWNERFTQPATETAYAPQSGLDGPLLVELTERFLALSSKGYQRELAGSPLSRPRRAGMLRNLCVALGNWGDPAALSVLTAALRDHQPLVRGHAAWALGRLEVEGAGAALEAREQIEGDAWVKEEIERALAG